MELHTFTLCSACSRFIRNANAVTPRPTESASGPNTRVSTTVPRNETHGEGGLGRDASHRPVPCKARALYARGSRLRAVRLLNRDEKATVLQSNRNTIENLD